MAAESSENKKLAFDHNGLQECLKELAGKRPIFHSEADFQFALAWKIKELCNVKDVRLEYPFPRNNETWYVDIVVILHDRTMVPIELKYKRAKLPDFKIEQDGYTETFDLKNHVARDFGRYDCLKDLYRVERIVESGKENWASEGYVVWLTNDKNYWEETKSGARDKDFSLHNRTIEKCEKDNGLKWNLSDQDLEKKVGKGRVDSIEFRQQHTIKWEHYSDKKSTDGQEVKLQYALLHITNDKCPACSNPSPSLCTQP